MKTCLRWAFVLSTLFWGAVPAHSHGASAWVPNPKLHY